MDWNAWVTPLLGLTTHPVLAPGGQLLTAPGANQATCWLNRRARIARAQCFKEMMAVCKLAFALHAPLVEGHQVQRPTQGLHHSLKTFASGDIQRDPPASPRGVCAYALCSGDIGLRPYPLHMTSSAFVCRSTNHVVDY